MQQIHPHALFRLSVLGPLASRQHLEKGDLKALVRDLAAKSYAVPDSRRTFLAEKTIEGWYYAWKRGGIDALVPKPRSDQGASKISEVLQEAICAAKKENPGRSLRTIRQLVGASGLPGARKLSRSSIHRLLQSRGLSKLPGAVQPEERRSFVAAHAGDIWYGDVMHGPKVLVDGRLRKVYLVSFMDDASRLITHSAFCPAETALEVEGVLKQALLRRGLPVRLVIDNGSAYRAATMQAVCARLEIRLVYCRPYTPESKGKLERWHRTLRQGFLNELDMDKVRDIFDTSTPGSGPGSRSATTRSRTQASTALPRLSATVRISSGYAPWVSSPQSSTSSSCTVMTAWSRRTAPCPMRGSATRSPSNWSARPSSWWSILTGRRCSAWNRKRASRSARRHRWTSSPTPAARGAPRRQRPPKFAQPSAPTWWRWRLRRND